MKFGHQPSAKYPWLVFAAGESFSVPLRAPCVDDIDVGDDIEGCGGDETRRERESQRAKNEKESAVNKNGKEKERKKER